MGFGFFVQITGTNTILYYSPMIFKRAGVSNDQDSILVSAIVQVFSIVGVLVSMAVVDRWGADPAAGGRVGDDRGHLLMTVVFAQSRITTGTGYLAVGAIALFYVGFYFGIGSLIWVYCGEAFPARLRSVGASALLITDFVANLAATFAFPGMLSALGGSVTFAVFMVLSAAALVFMYKMAPETKQRSLEEIRAYWDNGGRWSDAPVSGRGDERRPRTRGVLGRGGPVSRPW
ncbi:MFS transporter [Streptomyces sp. M19]